MLDTTTKRRIDTARDILVGKVPDPKSQVEQITIALIYKFMDDIDAESEELGGQRTFFSGDFARFGWPRLVRSGLGGYETLTLYAEAITRMPENPGIPPLFRDIFNNAYLPYRDPETLRAFLKIIDEFEYDHSERLGDAFEYLLSILGSQGDAGQFRTPRHIIDFIVEIIDPKKDETILDPACGTAGFLISSYKHIQKANTEEDGNSMLTPDEKGRLADNFKGYDISPDMVRLSLVNMYLHGFVDPHIFEYDTLTSEERWNDYADVILANPPFMSPKGGIRPHSRFSVKSKRSEVLFVDYMAEHLTPSGRAGIIVPEGIIFQSQNAHKQLRKMLVEDYLVAVVSLPAGVFQPYSGVKTSILILDKALAKRTDRIGFFKAENDGFDLGAQRRSIDKNDLPQVRDELSEFLRRLRAGEAVADSQSTPITHVAEDGVSYTDDKPTRGLVIEKLKVAEGGEYNLSGERYREDKVYKHSKWPMVAVKDVCDYILSGGTPSTKNENYWNGDIPWITSADIVDNKTANPRKYITEQAIKESATNLIKKGNVIVVTRVGLGKLFRNDFDVCISQDSQGLIVSNHVSADYLTHVLKESVENFKQISQGSTIQGVTKKQLVELQIPLPPLEVQREIVAEIEGYQRVIDGARAVVENYRPHIVVDPEWPMVELGEICSLGGKVTRDIDPMLPYLGADSIESNTGKILKMDSAQAQGRTGPVHAFAGQRILYSKIRPYLNKLAIVDLRGYCSSDMYPLLPDQSKVEIGYLATYMLSEKFNKNIRHHYERASIPKINRSQLFSTKIPIPSLETQRAIVAEIEAEQALVGANRDLIERFEGKVQATISRVWDG